VVIAHNIQCVDYLMNGGINLLAMFVEICLLQCNQPINAAHSEPMPDRIEVNANGYSSQQIGAELRSLFAGQALENCVSESRQPLRPTQFGFEC